MAGAVSRPRAATPAQLASWRSRLGYTHEQAAETLGVGLRTWYRWAAGGKSPKALGERFRTEGVK